MTRVVVLPMDETACGYYRLRLPAGAVQQARSDWQIEVYRPSDIHLGGAGDKLVSIHGLPEPDKIDLLVLQRVSTPLLLELVKWMQSQGTAVVIDADDAMWAIDKENVAYKAWNGYGSHWRILDSAMELADICTVTTPALARRYGKHGRCEILPNCIPSDLDVELDPVTRDDLLTVGWAGFTGTHPGDLKVVGDAMKRTREYLGRDGDVLVIGDGAGASRDWGVPVIGMDPVPIGLPYYNALTHLDIGLVPLRDTPFNRAKSHLKALEYAASGVAVIASPTPANRALATSIPMELASIPDEWHDAIVRLSDPSYRDEVVIEAWETVHREHTYGANAQLWIDVWERALNRRAKMSA